MHTDISRASSPAFQAAPAEAADESRLLRWLRRLVWLGTAALLAAWAALYLTWPFGQDHGAFAWVAGVIQEGGLPYRDAWEVKGPLVYYVVALANTLFGRNQWGIRLFDLLVLAAGLVPLYHILRGFTSPAVARAGLALFLLWYAALNYENTAQPDGWASVMLTAAAALLLRGGRTPRTGSALLAGALIGLCTLFKPTYLMFLALPFLFGLLREEPERGWRIRFWGAAALGYALPIAAALGWFAAHGALGAWFEVQGVWLGKVYTGLSLPWHARINKTLQALVLGSLAPAVPFAAAGLYRLYRRDRASAALLAAWAAAPVATILLQGKPWMYLWIPVFPPLVVMAGVGLHGLAGAMRGLAPDTRPEGVSPLLLCLAALLLLTALLPVMDVVWNGKAVFRGGEAALQYDAAQFGDYGKGPSSLTAVAEEVRAQTGPEDRVLLWGMTGVVNFLSDRASPSRFGVNLPLREGGDGPIRRAYRQEFLAAMRATPPKVVVIHTPMCELPTTTDGLADFPELATILARDYHPVRAAGCWQILRADEAPSGATR